MLTLGYMTAKPRAVICQETLRHSSFLPRAGPLAVAVKRSTGTFGCLQPTDLSVVGALRVHAVYRRLLLTKPTAIVNIHKELQRGIHLKQLGKD